MPVRRMKILPSKSLTDSGIRVGRVDSDVPLKGECCRCISTLQVIGTGGKGAKMILWRHDGEVVCNHRREKRKETFRRHNKLKEKSPQLRMEIILL